jgi:NADPH2:quinone reductase
MPGDWLVPVPNGLNTRDVMALGTAGLSAALAVAKLEAAGITPDQGPIAVTGASGGVGSFAIDMLSLRGYEVVAISGSPAASDYLLSLGATRVINRHDILADDKPLGRATWAGVIDNAGGSLLANLLKAVLPNGAVASVGLAGGAKLVTTVLPFILRGVSLLGVNSVSLTPSVRAEIWSRIASDLKPRHTDTIAGEEIDLAALPERLDSAFGTERFGRSIVRIGATDK